jgi:hypothetical protein
MQKSEKLFRASDSKKNDKNNTKTSLSIRITSEMDI